MIRLRLGHREGSRGIADASRPLVLEDASAHLAGDVRRAVGAVLVDHHHVVAPGQQRAQRVADVVSLVERVDHARDAHRHRPGVAQAVAVAGRERSASPM